MIKSTNNFKYAATLLGALAIFAIAPTTAFAEDNDPSGPGGGNLPVLTEADP